MRWWKLPDARPQLVGAIAAGVDILPARDGTHYVLEVNAVPGWKALAETLQQDIASVVLNHVSRLAAGGTE